MFPSVTQSSCQYHCARKAVNLQLNVTKSYFTNPLGHATEKIQYTDHISHYEHRVVLTNSHISFSQLLLSCLNNSLLQAIFHALKAQQILQYTLAEMEQKIPVKPKD